ncbi:MAG: helix-turn-helix domain-containing protein [Bacilli bacterium]|jgi:excisionase family DNA binding protein
MTQNIRGSLTTIEAAAILKVSKQRIQQLIAAGLLRGEKRAGAWFIDAASVEERKGRNENG